MNKRITISIPDELRVLAVKRAEEGGFESLDDYVRTLIEDDQKDQVAAGWLLSRLEEGLASPSSGPLTREKLDQLVQEGIKRASR